MSRESERNQRLKNENKNLRDQKETLENENRLLSLENEGLKQKSQSLWQQLESYKSAEENQLTVKEDLKISTLILLVLLVASIVITCNSFKYDTNKLGLILAVFSFIITILSFVFDLAKTLLHKCNLKSVKLISLTKNLDNNISPFVVSLIFTIIIVALFFSNYRITTIMTFYSNFICSVTLILYFLGLLINKVIWLL